MAPTDISEAAARLLVLILDLSSRHPPVPPHALNEAWATLRMVVEDPAIGIQRAAAFRSRWEESSDEWIVLDVDSVDLEVPSVEIIDSRNEHPAKRGLGEQTQYPWEKNSGDSDF